MPHQDRNGVRQMRKETAALFGSQCYVCRRPFGRHFSIHHLRYPPGWRRHSDFPSSTAYNEYVLPLIRQRPDVFLLLCRGCHRMVSITQRIADQSRFERLLTVMQRSRLQDDGAGAGAGDKNVGANGRAPQGRAA